MFLGVGLYHREGSPARDSHRVLGASCSSAWGSITERVPRRAIPIVLSVFPAAGSIFLHASGLVLGFHNELDSGGYAPSN